MKYAIQLSVSCFMPTVEVIFNVPDDEDPEEYIDEYLEAVLGEEFKYNCEWTFK